MRIIGYDFDAKIIARRSSKVNEITGEVEYYGSVRTSTKDEFIIHFQNGNKVDIHADALEAARDFLKISNGTRMKGRDAITFFHALSQIDYKIKDGKLVILDTKKNIAYRRNHLFQRV